MTIMTMMDERGRGTSATLGGHCTAYEEAHRTPTNKVTEGILRSRRCIFLSLFPPPQQAGGLCAGLCGQASQVPTRTSRITTPVDVCRLRCCCFCCCWPSGSQSLSQVPCREESRPGRQQKQAQARVGCGVPDVIQRRVAELFRRVLRFLEGKPTREDRA